MKTGAKRPDVERMQMADLTAPELGSYEIGFSLPPKGTGNRTFCEAVWIDPPPGLVLGLHCSQSEPDACHRSEISGRQEDGYRFGNRKSN